MTDSVFDTALERRFNEAPLITAIEVTSNDMLLIRDLETGQIMRIPISILYSALGSAFASLVDGKVPASQLPSYVDDVLEYSSFAAFPATGESGKIYVTLDSNLTYRWSGTTYVEISKSLALGESSSTAYRGDRGKSAYDHSQTSGNPHNTTKSEVGLSNVSNIRIQTGSTIVAFAANEEKDVNITLSGFSSIANFTANALPSGAWNGFQVLGGGTTSLTNGVIHIKNGDMDQNAICQWICAGT